MLTCACETRVMQPRTRDRPRHVGRLMLLTSAAVLLVGGLTAAAATWRPDRTWGLRPGTGHPETLAASKRIALSLDTEDPTNHDDWEPQRRHQGNIGTRPDARARGRYWIREAERLRLAGRIREAITALDQAQAHLPRTPLPCLRAAQLLLSLEYPAELRRYAACARERAPHLGAPYLYEGIALQMLGDDEGAAVCYETFARLAPRSALAWEARFVSRRLGRTTPGSVEPPRH